MTGVLRTKEKLVACGSSLKVEFFVLFFGSDPFSVIWIEFSPFNPALNPPAFSSHNENRSNSTKF